jgi:hypothetical protein
MAAKWEHKVYKVVMLCVIRLSQRHSEAANSPWSSPCKMMELRERARWLVNGARVVPAGGSKGVLGPVELGVSSENTPSVSSTSWNKQDNSFYKQPSVWFFLWWLKIKCSCNNAEWLTCKLENFKPLKLTRTSRIFLAVSHILWNGLFGFKENQGLFVRSETALFFLMYYIQWKFAYRITKKA